MKGKKLFTAFSAALLLAVTAFCGCTDRNTDSIEKTESSTTAAVTDIAVFTTKAPFGTAATVQTTKKLTTSAAEKATTSVSTKKNSQTKKTTASKTTKAVTTAATTVTETGDGTYVEYHFRSRKQLNEHFEKHGGEFSEDFDYRTAKDYEKGASDVINNSEALHKTEAEDGDGVYYLEDTNEFVILSTDGYIRTYFRPNGGKSYYDRQ